MKKDMIFPDLLANTGDFIDTGINHLANSEVLKEIPVVKSILNIYHAVQRIKDYFLHKKIKEFLDELDGVAPESIKEFLLKMENEPEFEIRLAEIVLFFLDRADSIEKAKYICKIFKAYITRIIDMQMMEKLVSIIDKLFYKDIECIANYNENRYKINPLISDAFMFNGITNYISPFSLDPDELADATTPLSEIGELLSKILFKNK